MAPSASILLIGASGMLGSSILDACLEAGHTVRALMRPGKEEIEESLRAKGVEVVHGDALKPETLPDAMKGIDVVICALHNDPKIYIQGHKNVIDAAEAAGVKRMVPSDFSVDYFKLNKGENFNLDMRMEVAPYFEGKTVRPIHVLIGAFIDTMLDPNSNFIDWNNGILPYFGDGKQPCDFTSVANAGRVVAAAVSDYGAAPEVVRFAGDVLTMEQLAASIAAGTGKELKGKSNGSIEDLAAFIKSKKEDKNAQMWEWLSMQYHHNMVSGRGKMDPLNNDLYADFVKPESVEQFAKRTKDVKISGMGNSNK